MKKLILVLIVSFFLVQIADAQLFKFGIKAGIGYSNLKIEDLTRVGSGQDLYDLATGDGVMAYHVGIQTRIKIAMLFIQPELYFNDGGGTVELLESGDPPGTGDLMNIDLKSVDLPILIGVKLGPLRINAGPVGSYVISEPSISMEIANAVEDYTVITSGMTWGFQAGLGVDLSKISLDVRYEGSLAKLGDEFTIEGVPPFTFDARPSQWVFSLGFWFK